jgi:hypothetical protein
MVYVREVTLDKKKPLSTEKKKEAEDKLGKLHKEESRLVKGVFKNLEAPGGEIEFAYRQFPQDPVRIYKFTDGETYDIPICVAKHLNNTCNEKMHQYIVDKDGKKTVDVTRGRQRYQFLSTEFM